MLPSHTTTTQMFPKCIHSPSHLQPQCKQELVYSHCKEDKRESVSPSDVPKATQLKGGRFSTQT